MYFSELSLFQFRNISQLNCSWHKNLNIIVGQNGNGKTNIIESLFLLTQGHSFRFSKNENIIQIGKEESAVRATVFKGQLKEQATLVLNKNKKIFFLNNKKISVEKVSEKFPCVIFSPESLSAIKESSELRRNLIDELLISTHANQISLLYEYKKILKTRNKILKDIKDGNQSKETLDTLESINPLFSKSAAELCLIKIEAIKIIIPEVQNIIKNIIKNENVDFSVEYVVSGENALRYNQERIESSLKKRMIELEKAEKASGYSLVGPHKHDIVFLYNQNNSRFFCSQGQQRALILSFKMAQIVYHRKVHNFEPVLLLDDVLSEFDLEKRSALISFLSERKSQIFITTTDLSLTENFKAQNLAIFKIDGGKILERSVL